MGSKTWMMLLAMAIGPALAAAPATQPATAPAETPATQPSPEVLGLIAQMGGNGFLNRQHAEDALVRIGTSVEPALRQAAEDSASPEIRARAAAALIEIEQHLADEPTYITLHVKDARPSDVLRDISRQAKVHIVGMPQGLWSGRESAGITLDVDHEPFWSVMAKLCTITHTHPQASGSADIALVKENPGVWYQAGRFAFVPNSISHNSTIDLINGGSGKSDTFSLTVLVDPKYHSVSYDQARFTVAEDENGISLLNPDANQMGFWNPGFNESWCFETVVPMAFPPSFGHRLAKLRGTVVIRLPMGVQTLKIPDLVKAVGTATVGGDHKVDVVLCNFNGKNAVSMHLQITKLTAGSGSMPGGIFQEFQSARVIDANGTQLLPNGGGGGNDTQFDWQGQFVTNGRPLKPPFSLEWETISKVETVTVPFTFTNLPLPPP